MSAPLPLNSSPSESAPAGRCVAWIDGVGAYLLCWNGPVEIGGLSGGADVRIAGNLARRHATIRPCGEGYLVESEETALVATDAASRGSGSGRVVSSRTNLASGDELVLFRPHSPGVRLRLSMPNPLTSTGVLRVASDHRTEPRFDAVILLAEACLLGPGADAHIRCREWPGTLVLFRRDGQLRCKSNTPSVPLTGTRDGEPVASVEGAIPLESGMHVTGPGISFRLEGEFWGNN